MIFKTIPQNGASWQKPLLYNLEFGQRESQIDVEIYDELTSEILGRILLYNTASAEIDIAPYIRTRMVGVPIVEQRSPIAKSRDACRVVLRANGEESEPRLLFRSDISYLSPQVLTNKSERDTIAVGEQIRLTILAGREVKVSLSRGLNEVSKSYSYLTDGLPCEVVLPINDASLGEEIMVQVVCDNELVGVYSYRVVERDSSAVRLAWVNSRGGMECRTFPQSVRRSLVVKAEDVESECGWYRRVVSSTVVRRVMMPWAMQSEVDAILDILLSPMVVRCDNGEDIAVQLLTDSVTYDDCGRVRRLEFDIKEEWKGGVL